ncbi:MAG TPA: hypothetical protein VIJ99_07310 [Acidimicrobiales bacterium]
MDEDLTVESIETPVPDDVMHLSRPRLSRSLLVLIALALVAFAELFPRGGLQSALADLGFAGLVVGAVAIFVQGSRLRIPVDTDEVPVDTGTHVDWRRSWRWTMVGLGILGLLITQTWFRAGTVIAGGDISPPVGTAWTGRIFASYGWSGFDLGGPVNNQLRLPWAVVEWTTVHLGGTGALAQRLWFSLLVALILVSAGALARSLGFSPFTGAIVSVAYFFSPMTFSEVGQVNDVFLSAMVLIPLFAAAVISYGNTRLRLWQVGLVFVLSAPFVGYAYANPPLVGMLIATTLFAVLISWAKFGRRSAVRAFRGAFVGGGLLALASLYWLIPAVGAYSIVATGSLSSLSAWAFTESRATLTNGLWLNNTWGWSNPEYYPYSRIFGFFPLDLIPVLVPLMAFSVLARRRPSRHGGDDRFKGLIALSALVLVLLSTGTDEPGRWIFDPLYNLPHGWLLREPGRFLMAAGLGYALLVGVLIDQTSKLGAAWVIRIKRRRQHQRERVITIRLITATLVAIIIAGSFPLWTGMLIPGKRQELPSSHVAIPAYWTTMGHYLNGTHAPNGSLLVMPPDDFYQMPYTWFYGNDSFIVDMLGRHVIVPSAQSYGQTSLSLLSALQEESSALLNHQWATASAILNAVDTPLVLVRGDVESEFPGRDIVSPTALASALRNDPEMVAVKNFGPLSIYKIRSRYHKPWNNIATVASSAPNLGDLGILPARTALVTSKPLAGVLSLTQLAPVGNWTLTGTQISTQMTLPGNRQYRLATSSGTSLKGIGLSVRPLSGSNKVTATVKMSASESLIDNGNFEKGKWGPVGNCQNARPLQRSSDLGATIVNGVAPGGLPALKLTASLDSACETTVLRWHSGPVLLSLWARSVNGATPSICVWEQPSNTCAPMTPLTATSGWHHFGASLNPVSGTTSLTVFVYANAVTNGGPASVEYANVEVTSIAGAPNLDLIGTPAGVMATRKLDVLHTSYVATSNTINGTKHVLVNGLTNGYLYRVGS